MKRIITLVAAALCSAGCTQASSADPGNWKMQELAVIALTRCLHTGGHLNLAETTQFVAEMNEQHSGQYQRVYDSIFTGVSSSVNEKVSNLIKKGGGCRNTLDAFAYSEPSTPFKQSLIMDWIMGDKVISYPDD